MGHDAVLTVLWIEREEQQHRLVKGAGAPACFREWLRTRRRALEQSLEDASLDGLLSGLPEVNAQHLLAADPPPAPYRYLLTIAVRRRRILLSAWRWHASSCSWLRLRLPREI